jgi:P27 family predicted phage terminase small subunit
MPRGRPPKPTVLKLITGNPGCRPLNANEPQPRRQLPAPPVELCEDGKVEWRRICSELHRLGLLTVLDRGALAAYCQAYGRWIMAERELLGQSLIIETGTGSVIQNPLVGIANKAMLAFLRCAVEFGMTPAARSRISGKATADETNTFAEFGA